MNNKELVSFDIEVYCNYLLLMFKRFSDGKVLYFEKFNDSGLNIKSIKNILSKYTIVTFNGIKFDRLIAIAAMSGFTNKNIHDVCSFIIENNSQPWVVRKQFGLTDFPYDEIDLIEVAPLKASLKIYAGRLHAPKMQDLPISPHETIKEKDLALMRSYCENDLDDNILLFKAMEKDLLLREKMSYQYNIDLRSKSDAQIAEAVIKHELKEKYNVSPVRPKIKEDTKFYFKAPTNLGFETIQLDNLLDDFCNNPCIVGTSGHVELSPILSSLVVINDDGNSELLNRRLDTMIADLSSEEEVISVIEQSHCKNVKSILRKCKSAIKNGTKVEIPKTVNHRIIKIGNTKYKIGIGGLHSMEETIAHIATDNTKLKEYDVRSYYPAIILNNRLTPKHLGQPFLDVYESLVTRRLNAKANGDKSTADTLKTTINGTFGKFSSKWSFLYSPELMMHITITGQLSLLMLIETLEENGIPVVSANTDGIVLSIPHDKEQLAEDIVYDWELLTDYIMESADYKGLYSRDVNNYIAIKTDGAVKAKGAYAKSDLKRNPVNEICKTAVINYLKDKTPVEETIKQCKEITQFVTVRVVNGGALYENKLIGKAIRWYYADDELDNMYYKTSGNKVPRSDGAQPLMNLPDKFPDNVDYKWYMDEANKMLEQIGVTSLQ